MVAFWGVITALTVIGGPPIAGGLWLFESWRSRRRNRRGACASCGTSWRSTASSEPWLIHGRLVCEDCAAKARRRMPWQFGVLGLAAGVATALTIAGADVRSMILFPVASTAVMTVAAVQLMKLGNRRAQRRIAAGEFPDMETLRAEVTEARVLGPAANLVPARQPGRA